VGDDGRDVILAAIVETEQVLYLVRKRLAELREARGGDELVLPPALPDDVGFTGQLFESDEPAQQHVTDTTTYRDRKRQKDYDKAREEGAKWGNTQS
jgi:hypothetical protein